MKERESYSRTKDLKWQKVHFLHIVLRLDSLLLLFDFKTMDSIGHIYGDYFNY